MSDDDTTTRGPDEIRQEIDQTRDELAETAAALAEKADVKARAQDKVDETKANVQDKVEETKARITEKVSDVKEKAQSSTPPNVGDAAASAQTKVKENPVTAAVVGAFAAGFLIAWVLRR